MLLTVAIPCYKSAKTLPTVVENIRSEFQRHSEYDYQIVLVNDGSADDTFAVITKLCAEDNKIVGVDLSKNYGQAAAKMAALPYVKGEILVYMDDDGQHDAQGIFELVRAIDNGADVAIARFQQKKHTAFKRITSKMNSEVMHLVLNKPKDLSTSSFVAYSSFVVARMKEYDNTFLSLLGFVMQYTQKIVNVDLTHHERIYGSSGYTLKKLFKLSADSIFGFSTVPIQLIGLLCMLSAVVGAACFLVGLVFLCVGKICFPWMLAGCLFIVCAVILLALAILGEYIGRMSLTLNGKPQYSVRSTIND